MPVLGSGSPIDLVLTLDIVIREAAPNTALANKNCDVEKLSIDGTLEDSKTHMPITRDPCRRAEFNVMALSKSLGGTILVTRETNHTS